MIEQVPYIINIIILVPVCYLMFFGNNRESIIVFQRMVKDSLPLRLLVGSMWFSILTCSFLGVMYPHKLVAILLMQWIYKALYILVYVIPNALNKGIKNTALGIAISFAAIVITWPYFIAVLWHMN
ncbi:hypothetical protein Noda2021_01300 [Candidatus Dependentiae bacterium Noda2021]|nr:hypothetical protein Noda2021_01300 [Candidatus Dependentiae bacterium Noda2021]